MTLINAYRVTAQGVRFDPDMPQTLRLEFAKSNTKVAKPKQQSPQPASTHPTFLHPLGLSAASEYINSKSNNNSNNNNNNDNNNNSHKNNRHSLPRSFESNLWSYLVENTVTIPCTKT